MKDFPAFHVSTGIIDRIITSSKQWQEAIELQALGGCVQRARHTLLSLRVDPRTLGLESPPTFDPCSTGYMCLAGWALDQELSL